MKKNLQYIGINGLLLIAVIYGKYFGSSGAESIVTFYIWFQAITVIIAQVVIGSEDTDTTDLEAELTKSPRPNWRQTVDPYYDFVIIVLLVFGGSWFLGIVYTLTNLIQHELLNRLYKEK